LIDDHFRLITIVEGGIDRALGCDAYATVDPPVAGWARLDEDEGGEHR
jgi:hypothetical protein